MRALVFTDIHIKPDNLHHIDLLSMKLRKVIKMYDVNTVIILGDILHSHERLNIQCMNKACELIQNLGSRIEGNVYIVVGNHDMIDSSQFLSEQHWLVPLKGWEGVEICDTVLQIEDGDVVFCPFVERGKFVQALDTFDGWKKAKVVFAHQEVRGCKYNGKISTSNDVWLEEYPQLISGHIHLNQRMKNIYYIGSVQQVSFGEGDRNFVAIVDTDSDLEIQEVELHMPKRITINTDASEVSKLDTKSLNTKLNSVRIVVSGTPDDFKALKKSTNYKNLVKEGVKVVLKQHIESKHIKKVEKVESFIKVLESLIQKENNKFLTELFNAKLKSLV